MTILVLGDRGQVAKSLREISVGATAPFEFIGRDLCDFRDAGMVVNAIESRKSSAVINAIAYTEVDLAETHQTIARLINTTGPAAAAAAAARVGVPFIHLSTDYVFDGAKQSPYLENDPTHPINVYGSTKRDGEIAILAVNPDAVILRTSWVYSAYRKNFLRTMLTLAKLRDTLQIVDDQMGAPTSAKEIARACSSIACARIRGKGASGVFHMTATGFTTWYGFAQAIFAQTSSWRGGKVPVVIPISTADYQTPARRPLNSLLNCDLIEAKFGVRLPNWSDSLRETIVALENEFGAHQ